LTTYLFDGTFEGLITSFYHSLKNKDKPNFISKDNMQINFFTIDFNVETNYTIYSKMENYLCDRCTFECFNTIYKAFLCKDLANFNDLFYFIKKAFKAKEQTLFMRNDIIINKVLISKLKVEREGQKMIGFLRFKNINSHLLIATYSPTHNITTLISNHFVNRYKSFNFIIYDVTRNIYAIYDKKICTLGNGILKNINNNISIFDQYEQLFKTFHKSVAIDSRKNLSLQMHFIPKKYWDFMCEME